MRARILVVDDETSILETFEYGLGEYGVEIASNARDALHILSQPNAIRIIFLDVVMPQTSGIELLPAIKRHCHDVKVVIMTAYGSKDVVVEALRADADDYIEKPFDIHQVRRLVARMIGRQSTAAASDSIEDKIRLAKEYLDRTAGRMVKIRDVAVSLGVSPKYLGQRFKSTYGVSMTGYRIKVRIDAARQLLECPRLTVMSIAHQLGYESVETFTRVFKRHTGLTPSVYRRRAHEGGGNAATGIDNRR